MIITFDMLTEKGACREGMEWFTGKFKDKADYIDLMKALAAEKKADWARWAVKNLGKTRDVYEADELVVDGDFYYPGTINIKGNIDVKGNLIAGGYIEVGGDYGIYVGISRCIPDQDEYGYITAKEKPERIQTGVWKPLKK